ncbi:MAG: nucleotidyltransferase domain-containing protein [FCB group bacterium]|jgi:predicted nucleotidyltransferase
MSINNIKISEEELLQNIKSAILSIEPDAEIFLFGSRARTDFKPDSDWDILIILPGEISTLRKMAVTHVLSDFEIKYEIFINRIYFSEDDWLNSNILHGSPFYENVIRDRIAL